ncbi:hypothetical protein EYZ11_008094 [Aspergillus tanneri]|uniref:O-methylsterigmatocystin oxidoreductase n=1 Tax=Aspergillus tanneri TaxID=1220188 RepID=A0A4S3JBP8_9EURO|nr:hypothetical protein EYZ11_008094 [Aspergillus tanneri]
MYNLKTLDLQLPPSVVAAMWKPSTLVGFVCAFFISQLLLFAARYPRTSMTGIPGPSGWPLIGIGLDLPARPREMLNKWTAQYGDIFKARIGWYDWVFFNSPRAVKEVFDRQAAVTSDKVPLPIAQEFCLRGDGVLAMTYSQKWKRLHAYLKQLLSPRASTAFIPSQEFEIKQLLSDLSREAGKNSSTDFYMHIRRMTFSIVMTSAYGLRIPKWDCQEVRDVYGNMPQGNAPECFAKDLMESNYRDYGLEEETMSWLASAVPEAGAETTASALNGMIRYLATFPEAQAAAHDEVTRVLGNNRMATLDDEPNMPYIRALIKETLRLCPVATTGLRRMAGADIKYQDHTIPKGTILLANINHLHWDPARFDEPFKFKPERYLNHPHRSAVYAAGADIMARDHFTFGAGRRICPGIHLAENGLFLAVSNIIWAYEFRPPIGEDGKEEPLDISDEGFMEGAIRVPKQYSIRILERTRERSEVIQKAWAQAQEDGYVLRGVHVDADGGVKGGVKK